MLSKKITKLKIKRPLIRTPFLFRQRATIIKRIRNKQIKAFICLLWELGISPVELLLVQIKDIDFSQSILHLPQMGGHNKSISLTNKATQVIRQNLIPGATKLFPSLSMPIIYMALRRASTNARPRISRKIVANMGNMMNKVAIRRYLIAAPNRPTCNVIVDGSLKTMSKYNRAIFAATEHIIRKNRIADASGKFKMTLPQKFERQPCCNIKNRRKAAHFCSVLHLCHLYNCSPKTLKGFIIRNAWPCLFGIDPDLDKFFSKFFRV
jgi:hypothetical protein